MKLNVSLATIFVAGLLCGACKGGTDPLKEVKTALNNKRPADAMKLIRQMERDTAYVPDVQYFELGALAAKKLNEAENEKLYLRRNPDTTSYFATQYDVFAYTLRADSAQRALQTDKNASTRVSGNYAALLTRLYPNLATASRYFLTKEKWNEAARFAKMTLEVRNAPIFGPRAPQISPALEMQAMLPDDLTRRHATSMWPCAIRCTVRRCCAPWHSTTRRRKSKMSSSLC